MTDGPWLLLTHHLPPTPPYLRVKVRRRLDRLGAVPLKNSVYVVPYSEGALEDFTWLRQEILDDGGEATLARASFVDGATDDRLQESFRAARDGDYEEIASSARELMTEVEADGSAGPTLRGKAARLAERLEEVIRMDYFDARGRAPAEHALSTLRAALGAAGPTTVSQRQAGRKEVGRGRTWVTRQSVGVDRMASAWLIRRFIDDEARFVFVPAQGYQPAKGELRFDMFEGEFTHAADACTFEVLCRHFGLDDHGLATIAEIVHDIDCKDEKFGRPEVAGVASMVEGIMRRYSDDEVRLAKGADLFESLHEHFAEGGSTTPVA